MPDDKRHDIAKHGEEENEIEPAAADEEGSELVSGEEEGDEVESSDEVAIDALLRAMPPDVRQAIKSMPPEARGRLTSEFEASVKPQIEKKKKLTEKARVAQDDVARRLAPLSATRRPARAPMK